jgi:hypothetical protein
MGLTGTDGTLWIDGVPVASIKEWSMDRDVEAIGGFGDIYSGDPPKPKPKRKQLLAQIERLEKANAELTAKVADLEAALVDSEARTTYEREAIARITKALALPAGWHALTPRQRDGMRIVASNRVRRPTRLETRKAANGE